MRARHWLLLIAVLFPVEAGATGMSSVAPKQNPSAAPSKNGQGQLMLEQVKSPEFLARKPASEQAKSSVKVRGVCRDETGRTYAPSDAGYSKCADSGSELRDYFGGAQRQAEVGVVLGK